MTSYNSNRLRNHLRNHKSLALKHAYYDSHRMYHAHMRCIADIKKK